MSLPWILAVENDGLHFRGIEAKVLSHSRLKTIVTNVYNLKP